jgi:hypothetical protein
MYVRVQNGYELYELHDVQVGSYGTKDVLWRDTTSSPNLWKNVDVFTLMGAASSSANGYLTSTDWSTFNSKGSGTVTSVAALTLGTTGTDLSSSVADSTTTPVITLNVPTASATNRGALSSSDWSKFDGKQNAITLTTTGTSGAATFSGDTLNIPNYTSAFVSQSILNQNHGGATIAAGATSASGWSGNNTFVTIAQEWGRNTIMPVAGSIKNWAINVGNQPATGSLVFTLRVNAATTAMTITIAAGSLSNKYYNTTTSISVAQGDLVSFQAQNNASTSSGTIVTNSIMYEI